MEEKTFEVNEDNVRDCWKFYEEYKEDFFKNHYSDASYDDFVEWCENNLDICPNCGDIFWIDKQEHLNEPYNPDNVCDWCIEENGYGK